MADRRSITIDGVTYRADRDPPVSEGGEPGKNRWYAVVIDPKLGRCIDQRVPDGYFRTMAQVHEAIRRHVKKIQNA